MRPIYLAWLLGLTAMWQVGCTRPCASTSQCGDDEMCVASTCQALTCERTIFAKDPKTGACMPLSGCFLTDEQRAWESCSEDPCGALDETSCLSDKRCQPFYQNPNVEPRSKLPFGGGDATVPVACAGGAEPRPAPDPFFAAAPGVNNGEAPKYPAPTASCSFDNSARAFAGCRAAPSIPALSSCESLKRDACQTRRDCTTDPSSTSSPGGGREPAVDLPAPLPPDGTAAQFTGECFSRFERPAATCEFSSRTSCLMNPSCQPVGSRCFCPPDGRCECDGGDFLGCEPNDRLRRCSSSADCGSDERCDNDEACIAPRTFDSPLSSVPPTPGTGSCLGACVPKGCAGLGENLCNADPKCDGGSYGTVCKPKPYCAGGDIAINEAAPGTGSSCGCDAAFTGCAEQKPLGGVRAERSLLVRDPEIIDDPAFRLDTVLGKLAPAGRVDEFTGALLKQVGAAKTLANGSLSRERMGYATFLRELNPDGAGLAQRAAGYLHPTGLINRLDLAKPGDCGEARLTYALTRAYTDGNQRMTLIFELRVPDDGMSCRSVAQRWAELSLIDDAAERRTRLIALYDELLKPQNLGQIRTNEFLNRTGKEPWELRELHLNGSGLPELAPVAQTVDKRFLTDSTFLRWAQDNSAALLAGNAVIPTGYLAASSTEDGGRLRLPALDRDKPSALDKPLNEQACAGCHLTETASPFVHIGERLGKKVGSGYLPLGRAVIDSFLQKELVTRAQTLQQVLSGTRFFVAQPAAATGRARVH